MTTTEELVWLIERLRGARSRRSRLRLLFEAWETVRGLSPADRLAVARELGFEGAERLVEEVARRQGLEAAPLVEAIGGLERSAGREVTEVLRGLADPGRRTETVGRLLEGAGRIVADLEPPTTAAGPADDAAQLAAQKEEADEDEAPVEEPPGSVLAAAPRAPTVPGVPEPAAAVIQPAVDSRAAAVVGRLAEEPRILGRLRLLDRLAGELAGAGRGDLVGALECFPAGWARRRALQRLLEAGVPRSVRDAVELLGLLQRPSERLWAASTLAATRPLDDGERAALLAAVPSPALRRRLSRRVAAK